MQVFDFELLDEPQPPSIPPRVGLSQDEQDRHNAIAQLLAAVMGPLEVLP